MRNSYLNVNARTLIAPEFVAVRCFFRRSGMIILRMVTGIACRREDTCLKTGGDIVPSELIEQNPALDGLPDAYSDWRQSALGQITDALEQRLLLDRIGPAEGLDILDVGCGDGVLATKLAASGAQVTGLDASAEMITAARCRASAAKVDLNLVAGDAGSLPFSAARFDVVISVATLCFSASPQQPIREMARVLKLGGRLILGELGGWNAWAVQRRVKGWLGSSIWRAARFRSRKELITLADGADLRDATITGAIFYPPLGAAARLMAPIDARIGRWTPVGAAFLVLTATKSSAPDSVSNPE